MPFPTKLLNQGEEIILDLRPHWWRIFPASAALAVAVIIGIVAWVNGNDAFQILGGILVLAALVTPPDVTTQMILFVVVYGLYEISIQLVRWVEKSREKKLKAEGLWDEDIHGEGAFDDE